jgi:hypothetical protein
MMVEAVTANGEPLPSSLIVLLRHLTGGFQIACEDAYRTRVYQRQAVTLAASMLVDDVKPTIRKVASRLGVEASTVSRWFKDKDLEVLAWDRITRGEPIRVEVLGEDERE